MPSALMTSSFWISALGRASFQAALGIVGVLIVGLLAPRLPGSVRCWLWRLAFGRALLALFWSAPVPLPAISPTPLPLLSAVATYRHEDGAGTVALPARPVPARVPGDPTLPLALGWLLGAAGCAGFGVRQFRLSRGLRQRSRPVTDPRLLEPWEELCALLSLPATLELREADELASPLVLGGLRPVVIVPASLGESWSPEQVRLMLAHELAHVRRHDLLWGWLPALTHVLLFFHPLVWLGSREWRLAHDHAADELALRVTGASAGEYARLLVRLAGMRRPAAVGLALMDARDTARTLERRLKLMSSRNPRGSGRWHLPALFLGACIALPIHVTAQDRPRPAAPAPRVASSEADPLPLGWPISNPPATGSVQDRDADLPLRRSRSQERATVRQRRLRDVEQEVRELRQQLDLVIRRNQELEEARRLLDQEARSLRNALSGKQRDQKPPRKSVAPERAPEIREAERQAAAAAAARQQALIELDYAERQLQAARSRLNAPRAVSPEVPPDPGANLPALGLTLRLLRQDAGSERMVAVVKIAARENEWVAVQLPNGKTVDQDEAAALPPDAQVLRVRAVRERGQFLVQVEWPAGGVKQASLVRPSEPVRITANRERLRHLAAPNPQTVELSIWDHPGY